MAHDRPDILATTSLAQLYARGQLPQVPDDPATLGDAEFGPVGGNEPTEPETLDPMEAFCEAWSSGFAPDSPEFRAR
ncbi:MAG: hypothetical protein ACOYOP_03325 [Microthrixaceae bacterium]